MGEFYTGQPHDESSRRHPHRILCSGAEIDGMENIFGVLNQKDHQPVELIDFETGAVIDWLVEVHMKFVLLPKHCIYVIIIGRYCYKSHVMRSQLQLVGVTALHITCKYGEIYPQEVSDCVYITDELIQEMTFWKWNKE